MRQCTPRYSIEVLAEATGTPWNYVQDSLVRRKTTKRLPPSSGIEMAIGDVPVPRREQASVEEELKDYSPSQEAASDPPSDGEQDENEDPGGGQMGQSSSSSDSSRRGGAKRSAPSEGSEELIPGEDPPTSPKRELEGRAEVSEPVRQRIDEGTTEVQERPEKSQKGEASSSVQRVMESRSVKEIESFLRTEEPMYHDDEEVELDKFEGLQAEFEEDDGDYESDGEEELPKRMPTWSNDFDSGPPKLSEEELAKVDGVSRTHEIERLTDIDCVEEVAYRSRSVKVRVLVNEGCLRLAPQRE